MNVHDVVVTLRSCPLTASGSERFFLRRDLRTGAALDTSSARSCSMRHSPAEAERITLQYAAIMFLRTSRDAIRGAAQQRTPACKHIFALCPNDQYFFAHWSLRPTGSCGRRLSWFPSLVSVGALYGVRREDGSRVDCCSRRGQGSNASYEASSHKFFPPIDDKTILTAICFDPPIFRTPKTAHRPGCRVKNSYVRRTLIRSAVSDTLKSFVIVEC
jgi:hypothetical protein